MNQFIDSTRVTIALVRDIIESAGMTVVQVREKEKVLIAVSDLVFSVQILTSPKMVLVSTFLRSEELPDRAGIVSDVNEFHDENGGFVKSTFEVPTLPLSHIRFTAAVDMSTSLNVTELTSAIAALMRTLLRSDYFSGEFAPKADALKQREESTDWAQVHDVLRFIEFDEAYRKVMSW